jgi:cyclin B
MDDSYDADWSSSSASTMNARDRRFGKVVTDNVAGNKSNVSLIRASKRLNDGDLQSLAACKKTRTAGNPVDRENQVCIKGPAAAKSGLKAKDCKEVGGKENRDCLTKAIETHVRKLDLDDRKSCQSKETTNETTSVVSAVTGDNTSGVRVTRSASQRSACRASVTTEPVDPALVQYRLSVDFSDPATYYKSPADLPSHVEDFDKSQLNEICSEPHYAHEVFLYYKEKEVQLIVPKYMHNQPHLKKSMRAVLVDWMVEVQESFELNHETLYLAVKMVDHYFSRKFMMSKDRFQLLGATCLLMASKYDERLPASIDDFLYICDDAYTRRDMILMEMDIFKTLSFFLGFPLSYRFLRRYARCAGLTMETLTLSRFILETSLMDYDLVQERDSKMAAAALLLALRMKQQNWVSNADNVTEFVVAVPHFTNNDVSDFSLQH